MQRALGRRQMALQPEMRLVASLRLDGSGPVKEVLVSPLGAAVVVSGSVVHVLEQQVGAGAAKALALKHAIQGQQAGITAVTLSGKGSEVIAGGEDGFLTWWHVVSGEQTASTQLPTADDAPAQQHLANGSAARSLAITAVAAVKGSNLVAAASGRCAGKARGKGRGGKRCRGDVEKITTTQPLTRRQRNGGAHLTTRVGWWAPTG